MINLEAQPGWPAVRQLETNELARGGANGNMNEQARALVARTELLNQQKANKSEIIQGIFEFETLAEFNAAKATLPLNCTVIISEENTTGSGTWGAGNNAWNGSVLKKSSYDPFEKSKTWVNAEVSNDILRPLRLDSSYALSQRFNKAVKSLSLKGDHNEKLIALASFTYLNGNLSIILARPDSISEVLTSSTNTKYISRFYGAVIFSGIQTFPLEPYGNTIAEVSGNITIDFDQLLQTDSLAANYTASNRLFDPRAIVDLNGEYTDIKNVRASLLSAEAKTDSVRKYVDISNGLAFTSETGAADNINTRFNKAIKSIALRGDYNNKLITLASVTYASGVFTIILARPDSISEVMNASTNTKFVARFSGAITFAGVQTLPLTSYGITSAEISGEITIDFDKLLSTDSLAATYNISDRLISKRGITDLNAQYSALKEIKGDLSLVTGTDPKNRKLNATIEDIVFFKALPVNQYLIMGGLFYSGSDSTLVVMQIFAADDTESKGTLWAQGQGNIGTDNKALLIFDQGYATVRMNYYYPTNVGAAVLGDNATFSTRGINKQFIKRAMLDNTVFRKFESMFVASDIFSLPSDYFQRSVKLFVKGVITDADYYVPSVFNWTFTNNKYRLTYQIRKMTAPDQIVTAGTIVYNGYVEFDTLADIKGTVTVVPTRTNNHPYDAEIDIDFTFLKYRTDNNNVYSPFFFNNTAHTFATKGFDVQKLRKASADRFKATGGGLTKYASLTEAVLLAEKGLFAVGGNLFKSTINVPLSKSDFACVNNPARLMTRKPKKQEYDFYYKGVKTRLEIIDADDNFYFVNSAFIVKAPHPMKQAWSAVANASAADLVVFEVTSGLYYSIPSLTELFTATALSATSISQARLTYDDELFIITTSTNKAISITENGQTTLRTFKFNGVTGTKYTFGDGINIIKDWCMTHHKNVMFVSDYDLGVSGVRGTTGGQKCYVSLDNGYTFTKCFDFTGNDWSRVINASNITAFGASQAHIHSVAYDPKQNVVWIITGDGAVSADNSSLFWSRDLGQTWTHKRSTIADDGARTQLVIGVPFNGCMAFGSDASNLNGTTVITYDGEAMVQEKTRNFASKSALLCFARSVWARDTSRVKYMSFGKDANQTADTDAKSIVAASSNGYTWEEVWSDNNPNIYGNVFCYDDSAGKLYISLDGSGVYKERVLVLSTGFI